MEDLLELDREHVWHPYSPLPSSSPPLAVSSAEGVRLRLADGRELIDGMSSWWCAIHGYAHPMLDQAVRTQLESMAHVMFGGLTHAPAVELATRLAALTPVGLDRVFLADSGSVAVEVAIKLALQYWQAVGRPERHRLMTVRGGYHGDTFGAMAVCDPVGGMHSMFTGVLPEHVFADRPPGGFREDLDEGYGAHLEEVIRRHQAELAGIIVEPVVQGAGGMHFYSPAVVARLRQLCDEHELLLILDEIATGFGRTGALFASDHAGVTADIMCLGKALTGGYLTLAATLCTPRVAQIVSSGAGGALMHGPTFMGNPLACAVALANLELLAAGGWRDQVAEIERTLADTLSAADKMTGVRDVRVLGGIGVVQLERPVDVDRATRAAVERGVWLRPFRDLVYTMPPYVCSPEELAQIGDAVVAAARAGASG
jgi:adenosylmethionine-8-amino-7-oxononanoate aminotransferase